MLKGRGNLLSVLLLVLKHEKCESGCRCLFVNTCEIYQPYIFTLYMIKTDTCDCSFASAIKTFRILFTTTNTCYVLRNKIFTISTLFTISIGYGHFMNFQVVTAFKTSSNNVNKIFLIYYAGYIYDLIVIEQIYCMLS